MHKPLDLYLICTSRDRCILFSPSDVVEQCEAGSDDRITRAIHWLIARPSRPIRWVGRMLKSAHEYYVKLEDKIDPVERVLKAVAFSSEVMVHHSPSLTEDEAGSRLRSILRKQRFKHRFWLATDSLISVFVVALTPILAPIPGPNVFFYYPVLRLLSHYRAIRGAGSALGAMPVQFKCLPELSGLEENLQTPRFDRAVVRRLSERLQIRGLDRFLERMV